MQVKHWQFVLGVVSGNGKTTLTVYIYVLHVGVLSGQGKTSLAVHLCIRSGIRSRENHINIVKIPGQNVTVLLR